MKKTGVNISNFNVLDDFSILEITKLAQSRPYIFFDMDGTILNSEPLHYKVIQSLCSESIIPTIEEIYGMCDEEVFPLIKNASSINTLEEFLSKKNELLITLVGQSDANNIRHRNIRKLLEGLIRGGSKLALVTASQYEVTHPLLKHCELDKYFDKIITEREVENTKPNPEPYLLAKDYFNAQAEECLIFEDSPTGIEAAQQSGIDHVVVKWFEGE